MFKNWKICKDSKLLQIHLYFQWNPNQNSRNFSLFVEINNLILNFVWKNVKDQGEPKISENKKNEVKGIYWS